jgi:hypothetical protein
MMDDGDSRYAHYQCKMGNCLLISIIDGSHSIKYLENNEAIEYQNITVLVNNFQESIE